jgi:hypothetical protein
MAKTSNRQDELFEAGAERRAEQTDAYFANSTRHGAVEQLRRADFRRYLDAVDRVFAAADAFRERRETLGADALNQRLAAARKAA